MGSFSIWHWLVVIVFVMLLFGRGKVSELMGDFAKGINSFKKGLADDAAAPGTAPAVPPAQIGEPRAAYPAPVAQPTTTDAPRA